MVVKPNECSYVKRYALVDYTLYILANEPPLPNRHHIELPLDTGFVPFPYEAPTKWERLRWLGEDLLAECSYYLNRKDSTWLLAGFGVLIFLPWVLEDGEESCLNCDFGDLFDLGNWW